MNKKGFTLIELLIVVVIIGILAAIAIPRFGAARERAYVSAMQSDLNQLRTAQEMIYPTNGYAYVDDIADLPDLTATDGVTLVIDTGDSDGFTATATHLSTDTECTYDSEDGIIVCAIP